MRKRSCPDDNDLSQHRSCGAKGVNWVNGIEPGEHLCALVERPEFIHDAIASFAQAAFQRNAKVVCILLDEYIGSTLSSRYPTFRALTQSALVARFRELFDVDKALADGRLVLQTSCETYLQNDRFDPQAMRNTFRRVYHESIAVGYSALYAFGDMSWALSDYPGVQRVFEYESMINDLAKECKGFVGFCYYDRSVFMPSRLRKALYAHPRAFVDDEYFPENFYYIPPEELLGTNTQQAKLDNAIKNLRERRALDTALAARTVELHSRNVELQRQLNERAILENQKQVAELLARQKSLFVASISHEIRTPLNGITSACTLLSDMALSPQAKECAELALVSSAYLHSLVDNVLTMSALDAGEVSTTEDRFDLCDTVQVVQKMVQSSLVAKDRNITLECDVGWANIVIGDQRKLMQVLLNLLSNACKYTSNGGKIHVSCKWRAGECTLNRKAIQVIVTDDGVGIAPERLEGLGKPFTQARNCAQNGAGLGLYISKRLLDVVGGSLSIMSDGPGKGTTSSFIYPLSVPSDTNEAIKTAPAISQLPAIDSKAKVLLVEDNDVNAAVMCKLLARFGISHVVTARDGQTAVDIVRNQQPQRFDVILMDVNLPGNMDGIETARLIRSLLPFPPRIVALTADVSAHVEKACRSVMDEFLTKPVRVEKLRAVLAHCTTSSKT